MGKRFIQIRIDYDLLKKQLNKSIDFTTKADKKLTSLEKTIDHLNYSISDMLQNFLSSIGSDMNRNFSLKPIKIQEISEYLHNLRNFLTSDITETNFYETIDSDFKILAFLEDLFDIPY